MWVFSFSVSTAGCGAIPDWKILSASPRAWPPPLSFRLFGLAVSRTRKEKIPVLVYGAGDGGEVVVRECRTNSQLEYQPIGFLDDDPRKEGRSLAGLSIFGGAEKLPEILQQKKVEGCIISSAKILENGHSEQIRSVCQEQGLWIKQLRLDFVGEEAE